jgi:hypothetical protein
MVENSKLGLGDSSVDNLWPGVQKRG